MVSISYFEAESNHAQILVAIIHKCFEVNLMAQQWKIFLFRQYKFMAL